MPALNARITATMALTAEAGERPAEIAEIVTVQSKSAPAAIHPPKENAEPDVMPSASASINA